MEATIKSIMKILSDEINLLEEISVIMKRFGFIKIITFFYIQNLIFDEINTYSHN